MSSFSHTHHTHTHSFQEIDDDGDIDENAITRANSVDPTEPHSPSAFVSPPASSMRPPDGNSGLVPDPMDRIPYGAHAPRNSVGRFMIVEGSPSRGPVESDDRPVSPLSVSVPAASPASTSASAAGAHHHSRHKSIPEYPTDQPRTFYTPHFPSMSINGTSCTLTLSISVLPTHGVSISPSASGLEFTPPKLKWTAASNKKEATFTATPLPTAREGKIKVCYIISGDDASDYTEPQSTHFQMYSEDTPLPLPSPPVEFGPGSIFSPVSDGGDSSSSASVDRSDRAAFLASGVPRQSGRFMVIDEEMQATSTTPPTSTTSFLATPASATTNNDNPFDLLTRLHANLTQLMETNKRLQSENDRLVQENAELRARGGMMECSPDNRFSQTPTPTNGAARMATIQHQPFATNTQQQKSRYGPPQRSATAAIPTQPQQPHSHTSPVAQSGSLSRSNSSNQISTMSCLGVNVHGHQSHHPHPHSHPHHVHPHCHAPVVMTDSKRQTLPANFTIPRPGSNSIRIPNATSNPGSSVNSPIAVGNALNPAGSPTPVKRTTIPNAQTMQQHSHSHTHQTSPPVKDGSAHGHAQAHGHAHHHHPADSTTNNTPPRNNQCAVQESTRRRKSMELTQQIEQNLTQSLVENLKHAQAHGR